MKLCRKIRRQADPGELPMLFQRILQNVIRDYYRRQKVQHGATLLSASSGPEDDEHDPLESIESADSDHKSESPQAQLEQQQTLGAIEKEIEKSRPVNAKPFSCVIGKKWI